MKKIIILIFLFISSFAIAQNDTTNWNLKANQSNGLFTIAENTNSFYGKSAGTINSPLTFDASNTIDTASWELVRNQSNGLFTQIQNRVTLFGKTAGQIKIPLNYNANPVTASSLGALTMTVADARYLFKDSTNIAYENQPNIFIESTSIKDSLFIFKIGDNSTAKIRVRLDSTNANVNHLMFANTQGSVINHSWSNTTTGHAVTDGLVVSVNGVNASITQLESGSLTLAGASSNIAQTSEGLMIFTATNAVFSGTTLVTIPRVQFGTDGTGSSTVTLGTNSPSIDPDPYTWITVTTSDGTTGYIPVWK